MNGVIGLSGLVLDLNLDQETRKYVNLIKQSAESLLTIINDILDFSKIEAGKMLLETMDFDPVLLVQETTDLQRIASREKGLDLHNLVSPAVPKQLRGDSGRIRQILLNLISNALKFTSEGRVEVLLSVEGETASGVELRIEIRDTGIGMSPETQREIFSPFAQADASTTRRYGGTGLGLSITKQLVEMMNGKIGFESELGRGTRFWLTLPLQRAQSMERLSLVTASAESPRQKSRILIAEDNAVNQLVAIKTLENLGYRADAVGNGLEALKALEQLPYDLVLMDCQMPEMDGYEATRKIREMEVKTGAHIPIIALTANAMQTELDRCLECGMDDYSTKPLNREELRIKMVRLLSAQNSSWSSVNS